MAARDSTATRARRRWGVVAAAGGLLALGLVLREFAAPAGVALLAAATVVAGGPIAARAVRDLTVPRVGIEALVTIAAIGAMAIGEWWEAAAVTWLFALGAALEAHTMGRTRRALASLLDLVPETATVVRDGEEVRVAPSEVVEGDEVRIRPGDRVPVDGVVVSGHAAVDEQTVTGESMPVERTVGDRVFAGTTAGGGVLHVRAEHVGADTALGRIIHRVEQAQEDKVPAQRFLERFARWYTPGVVGLAATVGLATGDVHLALTLLVIACPGALVISIPIAVVAGVGRGARRAILVKGGEHLEQAARVTAVAFDKTGTLTEGRPRVAALEPLAAGVGRRDVLAWAAAAEADSEHPLAAPLREQAAAEGLDVPATTDGFIAQPGAGVQATVGGTEVVVGTARLLTRLRIEVPASAHEALAADRAAGRTAVLVARDGGVVGLVAFADRVRDDAAATLARLRRAGIHRMVMLTGDAAEVAHTVARDVGLDPDDGHAELSPEDKLAAIRDLQADGERVAMLGDGVNDAPALATADVGVAGGAAATPVAIETADVALTTDQLSRAGEALALARRTTRVMRQNVAIALVTVAVLLAGVLAGEVHMAGGMLVHQGSVLAVLANALRLLRGGRDDEPSGERTEPVRAADEAAILAS